MENGESTLENITPICTVGDLVMINGFGNRVWKVSSFTQKASLKSGESESSVVYVLSCVVSNEHATAEHNNIMLVCKASFANTYLDRLDKSGRPPTRITEGTIVKTNRSPSPIKHSDTKRLDEILDQMSMIFSTRDLLGELSDKMEDSLYVCEEELYQLGEKNGWFK